MSEDCWKKLQNVKNRKVIAHRRDSKCKMIAENSDIEKKELQKNVISDVGNIIFYIL